ncbi:MAG: helix-turn-helix transcriptional regulator [Panacibacter sp.]
MIEISYNNSDFVSLIQVMARHYNVQTDGNILRIPQKTGSGFLAACNLPDGLSVLISDGHLNDELVLHRYAASQQYFILQFNESFGSNDTPRRATNEQHIYNIQDTAILLTSSLMDARFIFPAKVRIRSVRVIFGNDYLNSCIGNEMTDKFLSNYFSMLLKGQNLELIGTDYRVIMDELIKEKLEHPLRIKFIYNRATLLIEKLVTGFMGKLEKNKHVIKFKDDEINRLIKVEALLVKDFSGAPPVIAGLSKIAAMSPTKLKKDFKALYGLPIYEYYQKNRMMRAKALLMENRYAIKEVGMLVGYSNLGHFAGSFKKEFGVLPSEMNNNNHTPDFKNPDNHLPPWETGIIPV